MKRIDKVSGYYKLVASILTLGIISSGLAGCLDLKDNNSDTEVSVTTTMEEDNESFFRDLYFSSDNKEALELVRNVIIDYGNYMDHNKLLERCNDLIIDYKALDIKETGYYEKSSNMIVINSNIEDVNRATLFHEMMHFLSQNGLKKEIVVDNNKYYIGNAINEGMTQELDNEYFINDNGIYTKEVAYTKALIEILGKDIMLNAYFSNDLNVLLDRLEEYISRRDAETLIIEMDSAMIYSDDKKSFEECSELNWAIIEKLYKNVTGDDMKNNPVMLGYKSITCDENYMNENNIDSVVVYKDYFINGVEPKIVFENNDGMKIEKIKRPM